MICEIPKLTKCCFCVPLRWGLLAYGYLSLLILGIGLIGYVDVQIMSFAFADVVDVQISEALYFTDVVFTVVLICGTHKQIVIYLKAYYYYTLAMIFAMIVLCAYYILAFSDYLSEDIILNFVGICLEFYVVILVRSLIGKLENTSVVTHENQLQDIIEIKKENSIYPSVPAETV